RSGSASPRPGCTRGVRGGSRTRGRRPTRRRAAGASISRPRCADGRQTSVRFRKRRSRAGGDRPPSGPHPGAGRGRERVHRVSWPCASGSSAPGGARGVLRALGGSGDAVGGGGGGEDLVEGGGVDGAVEPEIQERRVRAGGDALSRLFRRREAAAIHQVQQSLGLLFHASFLPSFLPSCEASVAHDGASPGGEEGL